MMTDIEMARAAALHGMECYAGGEGAATHLLVWTCNGEHHAWWVSNRDDAMVLSKELNSISFGWRLDVATLRNLTKIEL